jgi:hypothetical protein
LLFLVVLSHVSLGQYFQNLAYGLGIVQSLPHGVNGAGLAVADFNGDGWDDITFSNTDGAPLFFLNVNGTFQSISLIDQIPYEIKQCNWVDYDDDGLRDLVISYYQGPFYVFHNDGNLEFTDVTATTGLDFSGFETYGHSWCDYDRDGDLDVYISNYNGPYFGDPEIENFLFNNNGDGTFTDVTAFAGVGNGPSYSFLNIWMYANNDLWPDIFISNDRFESENALYINNGDGTFTDGSAAAQVNMAFLSMGVAVDDYDNDGDDDIYTADWANNILYNNQNGVFQNVTNSTGTDIDRFTWGTIFGDIDNDGFKDLFIATQSNFMAIGQNQLLKGNGSSFTNITAEVGLAGDGYATYGSAQGDLNRDGALDIVTLDVFPGYHAVWMNTPNDNHYIEIALHGDASNKDGVGARMICYTNDVVQTNVVRIGESYLSQNSLVEHFGLGVNDVVDSLIVQWPSGIVDKYYRVATNQRMQLFEGEGYDGHILPDTDVSICPGDSIQLHIATAHSGEVIWSNNEVGDTVYVYQAGNYDALVYDVHGNAFYTSSIHVELSEPFDYDYTIEPIVCAGDQATLMFEENESWIEYSVNGDNVEAGISTALQIGWNEIVLLDQRSCHVVDSIEVLDVMPIQGIVNVADVICFGGVNGSISVQLTGGEQPYNWVSGSAQMTNLVAGNYDIEVFDGNGCTWQETIEITQPTPPIPTFDVTIPTCFGEDDGSVEIAWNTGTSGYQIEMSWSDNDELSAGEYWVQMFDLNGCEAVYSFIINEPLPLELTYEMISETEGQSDGSIQVQPAGGTPPYTFWWNSGQGNVANITDLPAGNYFLQLTDANGCSISTTIVVTSIVNVLERSEGQLFCYPNPVQDYLYVHDNVEDLELFDSTGRRVFAGPLQSGMIDLKNFANGIYHLRGRINGQLVGATIVKSP